MKAYADKYRYTKSHGVNVGDYVLIKQQKHHKISTEYEPGPYIYNSDLCERYSSYSETCTTDNRCITRIASHCKVIPVPVGKEKDQPKNTYDMYITPMKPSTNHSEAKANQLVNTSA